jgi:hypothetical protein
VTGPTGRGTADERDAARRLDIAIDELLAGRPDAPTPDDDSLEGTALVLGAGLPRLHPRFGFEERLAQRLRSEASVPAATLVAFPRVEGRSEDAAEGRTWHPSRRSVIGAFASGVSVAATLAGAVFVVLWRRARGSERSEGLA